MRLLTRPILEFQCFKSSLQFHVLEDYFSEYCFVCFIHFHRIYNCDGQLCPTGSSDAVKEVYRKFNTEAVRLFGKQ